jgi:S-adenosylmethionine-dependent methyltransferase
MKSDQNFDSRTNTFSKNIYGTSKGKIRQAVLIRDLDEYLTDKSKLRIIDIGGGQGQLALYLAELGHHVTITDISKEMLDVAATNADSRQLTNVEFIHSPLQELQNEAKGQFDLVLCHAVFEWLESPCEAFETLTTLAKSDGAISLMYFNQAGNTLANLSYGNFEFIKNDFRVKKVVKLNPQSPISESDVLTWIKQHKLDIRLKSGVRCFHDLMRNRDQWVEDFNDILAMELKYSRIEPYSSIGRYTHYLLERTQG